MASRRNRLRAARRAVLRGVIEQLERDLSMSSDDEITVIRALIIEFRRRGGLTPVEAPTGHDPIPGMGLFQALPVEKATPYVR
jgi:hypothetical protein